jgi:peptidoglycan/LPS O-acetylase OafA/YrhL
MAAALSVTAATKKTVHVPHLDGLRAVAVIFVLIEHFSLPLPALLRYGPLCVRFFFVLSGYFITTSLWKLQRDMGKQTISGTRHVLNFYANRLLRIGPPFYLALLVGLVLGLDQVRDHIFWLATFQTNNYIAWLGYWPDDISHFWSLAVQEQFYMLWPALVLLMPRRYFVPAMAAFIVFGLMFRLACIGTAATTLWRWVTLLGCIDSFAVGALVAYLQETGLLVRLWALRGAWASAIPLIAFASLYLGCALMTLPEDNMWLALTETVNAIFLAYILSRSLTRMDNIYGRMLSWSPLVYLGRISYGIYVYHVFVIVALSPWLASMGVSADRHIALWVGTLFIVSVGLSALSWHLLEKPCSAWKNALISRHRGPPAASYPATQPVYSSLS